MRRARITGKGRIEIVSVPTPQPGPNEVKIRIGCSGICGSDILEYLYPAGFSKCLGHEFAGVVVGVGSKVKSIKRGDRVVAYNFDAQGFAEYAVVKAEHVMILPKGLSIEQGSLIEPVTVVLTGFRYCGFRTGDTCFISGCGTIGLLAVQVARAFGARRIVAAEPNPFRRKKASAFGADAVIDARDKSVEGAVVRAAEGKVDFSIECAGIGTSLLTCAKVTRRGGTVCTLGLNPEPIGVSSYQLFTHNVRFHTATPFDFKLFEAAGRLMADKKINPRDIVTHRFDLADIGRAFELAALPNTRAIKIIIRCNKN